ncbi:MAG: ferritin [Deltaproteobacteria bacterium]
MEMKKKTQDAVNDQIQAEFYSAYLYLGMAAWAQTMNLKGFAHWLTLQAKEEQGHAMKLFDHAVDRGAAVCLKKIQEPPQKFKSATDIFENVLEHEKKVTGLINALYALAVKEEDYPLQVLLQWFITEQVEEEAHATEILEKLRLAGDKGTALIYMDKALGKRE